jgi:hypothetical protein
LLPGDVKNDEEGKQTMYNLGRNMAYVLKKLYHPNTDDIKPPK